MNPSPSPARARLLLLLSLGLNLGLAAVLWQAWHWPQPVAPHSLPARTRRLAFPPEPASAPPTTALAPSPTTAVLHWSDLASTNFHLYRDHLRAVGCPERTVRDILESEINEWFRQQREPLAQEIQQRFWDLLAAGGENGLESVQERFQSIQDQRRQCIQEVLGERRSDPEAETASRRESYAERYDWVPPELQSRIVDIEEGLYQAQQTLQHEIAGRENQQWTSADHQRRQQLVTDFEAARRTLLGERAAEFELRASSASMWASRLGGFEPTETEWRHVAQAQRELEEAKGRLAGNHQIPAELRRRYGLEPQGSNTAAPGATEATQAAREEAIARAQAAYEAALVETLGPERFATYQQAEDGDYQQARRVTRRLGLDDTAALEAREIQRAAQDAARQLRENAALDSTAREAALGAIHAEAVRSLRTTLGDRGLTPYQEYAGDWLEALTPDDAP